MAYCVRPKPYKLPIMYAHPEYSNNLFREIKYTISTYGCLTVLGLYCIVEHEILKACFTKDEEKEKIEYLKECLPKLSSEYGWKNCEDFLICHDDKHFGWVIYFSDPIQIS